jgi:hypothetical protein
MDWVILYIVCVMISAFLMSVGIYLEEWDGEAFERYLGFILFAILFPPLGIGVSVLTIVSRMLDASKAKRSK